MSVSVPVLIMWNVVLLSVRLLSGKLEHISAVVESALGPRAAIVRLAASRAVATLPQLGLACSAARSGTTTVASA